MLTLRFFLALLLFSGMASTSVRAAGAKPEAKAAPKENAAKTTPGSVRYQHMSAPPIPVSSVSLSDQIDRLVEEDCKAHQITLSGPCLDEEFLRRAYLDLNGIVPTARQVKTFLEDNADSAVKRAKLVDQLLASPLYARRMQYVFDELLIERKVGNAIPDKEWQDWLRTQFAKNVPWNQIAFKILSADGTGEDRPAAKFYLVRKLDVNVMTRDLGRIFLGVDLECAQCHDHPNITDYLQRHYYGITAFMKRTYQFTDPKTKKLQLGEKAENTPVKFTSVFTSEESSTMPRLMNLPTVFDPMGSEKQYIVKPAKTQRGIPRYSRRQEFAAEMVSYDNFDFRVNFANRLWAIVMGRGIVEPLDVRHSENAPANQRLLETLAEHFMQDGYNVRDFIRQLVLTKTYQRQVAAQSADAASHFACAQLKPLGPEQLAWSLMEVTGVRSQTLKAKQAELLKKDKKNGPAKVDDVAWQEVVVHDALKNNVVQFNATFARQGGQKTDFESTSQQALFLINGALLQKWLAPAGENLIARLAKLEDSAQIAEELYTTILSRRPSVEEAADISDYLMAVDNKTQALQEIIWAMLTSTEFRFNH